ncbi:immune inhibitor A domain-containing protein [Spartinivicinus poritis]|uniref:Immune inhibitor A n=1 Tax=Spartinivicinus poritis TaxID=2994640 RepID=A0ABT5U328_9GAMM|nr:immune inhibitor A domain-containing protein [Spartinivicinus sp. A2-2]MDE1460777.1 immune inhibitor A [Spartinivicinus sp. A2-2]
MSYKRVFAASAVGTLLASSLSFAAPFDNGQPFDMPLANEEKLISMLKKSGKIDQTATNQEAKAVLKNYLQQRQAQHTTQSGELAQQAAQLQQQQKHHLQVFDFKDFHQHFPSKNLHSIQLEQYKGGTRTDKVLAVLVEFPDYKHNAVGPEDTDMYYEDYTGEHYQQLLFSGTGYTGPNGKNLISMRQFYEQQSGGSYSVKGNVAGWYMAKESARYYGDNENEPLVRELVREALEAAAKDPNIDLSEFDQEDRYDYDNDGNYREPDGVVDHLMIFHSSVGEEAGGGDLGEDAIWSHRWNLGKIFKIPGTSSDVDRFEGMMAAYDYTIQPIDAAAGVCAHEYGHDLGLPDEYDTRYTGKGEPVSYWSVMSSGSWAGLIPGTEPTGFSAWAKQFLQANMPMSNWLHGKKVDLDDISVWGNAYYLDQANDKGSNNDVVRINLPQKKVLVNKPAEGQYEYFGGKADDLNNLMTVELDLTKTKAPVLLFKTWYQIEEDYDYGRVLVNGKPIPGNLTTFEDPNEIGHGHGITGQSDGWVNAKFDLREFAGQTISLSFNYLTDAGTTEAGFYIDQIDVKDGGRLLFSDNAEGDVPFTLAGFTVDPGYLMADHYYLLEWRNHAGVDVGLKHINRKDNLMVFDPGLIVWYVDDSYTDNWVGIHPGEGFLGVVDSDQTPVRWDDNEIAETRYQVRDAAFSMNWYQTPLKIEIDDRVLTDSQLYNVSTFFDLFNYVHDDIPDAGRKLPKHGLLIEVNGQSEDMTVGRVLVSTPFRGAGQDPFQWLGKGWLEQFSD